MLGSVLAARETAVNKTSICPNGLNVKGGDITKKEREIIKCQRAACAMEKISRLERPVVWGRVLVP